MLPMTSKQSAVKFNYGNQSVVSKETKIPQFKKQIFHKHDAIRDSQIHKYVVETFSTLNLQTKKSLPSQINNKYRIPNPKNKQYLLQMPQTCQSLVKIQDQAQQQDTPTLKNSVSPSKAKKTNTNKFNLNEIQQAKQTDFNQISTKPKPSGGKNKRVVKNTFNFESIQDAPNSFYQNENNSKLQPPGHSQVASNINNNSKRASKQIKTFRIQNIEEKKQSDFGGCCGFGIVNKIAFLSNDE